MIKTSANGAHLQRTSRSVAPGKKASVRHQGKRRHTRYDVEGVDGTFLFNLEVDVQNLSVAGMAVKTTRALNVGRRYLFTISKEDEEVKVSGRVAWCVLGSSKANEEGEQIPVYNAGIQFFDVLTDVAKGILHLIEDDLVLDLNTRVFGRFQLDENAAVSVDAAVEFQIHRISLSGMLAKLQGDAAKVAQMEAIIPFEAKLDGKVFRANARVAYVNEVQGQGEDEGLVELGMEFKDVSKANRALLEDFIASVLASEAKDGGKG